MVYVHDVKKSGKRYVSRAALKFCQIGFESTTHVDERMTFRKIYGLCPIYDLYTGIKRKVPAPPVPLTVTY